MSQGIGGCSQRTDGEAWQHSRAMVRQALTRSQVADTSLFESHLRPVFDAIPSDGATVDLGPLFFAFTLGTPSAHLADDKILTPLCRCHT